MQRISVRAPTDAGALRALLRTDPTLVLRAVQLLDCIDVTSTGASVLRADVRVSCVSPVYAPYHAAATAFVVIYCAGIPLFLAGALARSARSLVMRGGNPNAPVLLVASDVASVVAHVGRVWATFARAAPHGRTGRRAAIVPPMSDAPVAGRLRRDSVVVGWDTAQNVLVTRRLFDAAYHSIVAEAKTELAHMRAFSVYDTLLSNARKQRRMEVLQVRAAVRHRGIVLGRVVVGRVVDCCRPPRLDMCGETWSKRLTDLVMHVWACFSSWIDM